MQEHESDSEPIVLYDYWRSSASYRIRIALGLSGLKYSRVSVDLLRGEQNSNEHLERNPQGLVPVLRIGEFSITQSLAIIEFMHERGLGRFLPDDAAGRARVRSISYAIAMETHPICNLSVARYACDNSNGAITMETWTGHFIANGLSAADQMLNSVHTGRFSHGNNLTMADICLVAQCYNARRYGVPLDAFPRIRGLVSTLERIPAVAAAHPDNFKPEAK